MKIFRKRKRISKLLQEIRAKGITACPPHVSFTYPDGQEICAVCRKILKPANE